MTPEARLTTAVVRRLKVMRAAGEPIWWLKLAGSPMQKRGVPDLLIIYKSRVVFVELKAPGGKLTPLQAQRIREIKAAGGEAVVCWTADEVVGMLLDGPDRRFQN